MDWEERGKGGGGKEEGGRREGEGREKIRKEGESKGWEFEDCGKSLGFTLHGSV